MKEKLKMLLRLLGWFVICFITIYAFVFVGGWKLFESGNPILIEIGVAVILSVFVFAINEILTSHGKKIKSLQERVEKLEEAQFKEDTED